MSAAAALRIPLSPPSSPTIPNKTKENVVFPCIHRGFVRFCFFPPRPLFPVWTHTYNLNTLQNRIHLTTDCGSQSACLGVVIPRPHPSVAHRATSRDVVRVYAEVCCRIVGSARVRYFFESGSTGVVNRLTGGVTTHLISSR